MLYLMKTSVQTTTVRNYEKKIRKWFAENNNRVEECFPAPNDFIMLEGSNTVLYLDIPYDENSPEFIKINNYLEYPNGSSRFAGVQFILLRLEEAMKTNTMMNPVFGRVRYAKIWKTLDKIN